VAAIAAIGDSNPQVLEALLGVVQDATAGPKVRKHAALRQLGGSLLYNSGKRPILRISILNVSLKRTSGSANVSTGTGRKWLGMRLTHADALGEEKG
jgi:hypothetical protein